MPKLAEDFITKRFVEAYREMADTAKFRPEAPSDGWGNLTLSEEEVSDESILEAEALRYAHRLAKQDDDSKFIVEGCLNGGFNKLFIYLHETSQLCCGTWQTLPVIRRMGELIAKELRRVELDAKAR